MSTRVAVAGGGPGGVMLAYLLARAEIPVTLLETHQDFDRDFRGDSLHPYTLELLDSLGLAEDLLRLDHVAARYFRFHTPTGTVTTADYGKVRSRFPYVALMPQSRFLTFLAERASRFEDFELRTDAKVVDLLTARSEDRRSTERWPADRHVRGVRYRSADGEHELPADLVIAADGRFSRLRRIADLPARSLGATTDLLWFRLPRRPDDPAEADTDLYFGSGNYVGLLGSPTSWQVGYSLPKGGYRALRADGVQPIKDFLHRHVDWLGDRIELLEDFNQTTLLSVDVSRVDRWHRPGLLLIGDAAHVISPVGGNGILMAIQDAVVAANRLIPALRGGHVSTADLAAIQEEREPAIRQVQAQQVRVERRAAAARKAGRPLIPARPLKMITAIPGMRARTATANAYGPYPPRLEVAG